MKEPIRPDHPLFALFQELVHDSMSEELGRSNEAQVEEYLTGLLVAFLHTDRIFSIRDRYGRRLISVAEMVSEADVLLNADSFERERQVHKHIGDFILFWSGVYPEFLRHLRFQLGADPMCDYQQQGRESYYVVSTFDHKPYDEEAPIFRQLSEDFEEYAACLRFVRHHLPLHVGPEGNC